MYKITNTYPIDIKRFSTHKPYKTYHKNKYSLNLVLNSAKDEKAKTDRTL